MLVRNKHIPSVTEWIKNDATKTYEKQNGQHFFLPLHVASNKENNHKWEDPMQICQNKYVWLKCQIWAPDHNCYPYRATQCWQKCEKIRMFLQSTWINDISNIEICHICFYSLRPRFSSKTLIQSNFLFLKTSFNFWCVTFTWIFVLIWLFCIHDFIIGFSHLLGCS